MKLKPEIKIEIKNEIKTAIYSPFPTDENSTTEYFHHI